MTAAVRLREVRKTFIGGAVALDNVSLELDSGRIYGLVGPNGAGKSTLTNVISGYLTPDRGGVYVNGVKISEYHQAMTEAGVVKVEQHPSLAPALSLLEHLALLHPSLLPDLEFMRSKAEQIAEELSIKLDLEQPVEKLPIGQLRSFEIVRALILCEMLYQVGKKPILIFDESTAYLPIQQKQKLKEYLRRLTKLGYTTIVISHDLSEIMDVADEILVMTGGKIVSRVRASEAELEDLVRSMFEEVEYFKPVKLEKAEEARGMVALKIERLAVADDRGEVVVKDLELEVFEGEIHGIAAVPGAGEKELAECIYGVRQPDSGKIILFGEDVTGLSTSEMRRRGVGFLSDDRILDGLISGVSVEDNLTIGSERLFTHKLLLDPEKKRRIAEKLVNEFQILSKDLKNPIETLSGGNMQRAYIARVLGRWDKLLIALHPTVGLDPKGVKLFFEKVFERRQKGLTTVIFSPNVKELLSVCDRVSAFAGGKILGTFHPSEITVERLGMMISGLIEVA